MIIANTFDNGRKRTELTNAVRGLAFQRWCRMARSALQRSVLADGLLGTPMNLPLAALWLAEPRLWLAELRRLLALPRLWGALGSVRGAFWQRLLNLRRV